MQVSLNHFPPPVPHSPREDVELNPKRNSFVRVSVSNRDGADFLLCLDLHNSPRIETNCEYGQTSHEFEAKNKTYRKHWLPRRLD